jgi:hypothetical protein
VSAIHDAILNLAEAFLLKTLQTDVLLTDDARVGVVKIGPLQGDPDPDVARISVELYENDPNGGWEDTVGMVEIGGCITWRRRFTVLARCLLEGSREDLANSKRIGSTIRSRIEKSLIKIDFGTITADDGEIVTRGVTSDMIRGEMLQSGGPPDAYDIHIKIRFEVLTQNL